MVWMVLWMACAGDGTVSTGDDRPEAPVAEAPAPPAEPRVDDLPPPTEARYAASHILVSHAEAVRSDATRSRDEALELARDLLARAATEDFATLAKAHSDGPSAARGGQLGVYATGTMVPDFEKAVASVAPGELGPLVHTPFGWHVVRRDAVVEARASHILVPFAGCWRTKATRTRAEAMERLGRAQADLATKGFGTVAMAYSEGPSAASGGQLGIVAPGQMVPAFEDALFALTPGEVSEPVETPYGLHLILRHE